MMHMQCLQSKEEEASPRSNATEKPCRKIELGWLHFSSNEYRQVRTKNGGGTRHTTVDKKNNCESNFGNWWGAFFPKWYLNQRINYRLHLLKFVTLKGIKSIQHLLLVASMSKLNWSCLDFTLAQKKNTTCQSAHLKRISTMRIKA